MKLIASSSRAFINARENESWVLSFWHIKRVPLEELPLYVGWTTTERFEELLKGASR